MNRKIHLQKGDVMNFFKSKVILRDIEKDKIKADLLFLKTARICNKYCKLNTQALLSRSYIKKNYVK